MKLTLVSSGRSSVVPVALTAFVTSSPTNWSAPSRMLVAPHLPSG